MGHMSRHSPRTEGHCALYGREAASDNGLMLSWRARLHNEQAGMPRTDISGANTSVSLLWNPVSKHKDAYTMASHRKNSALKQVQDFGVSTTPTPTRAPAQLASVTETPRRRAFPPPTPQLPHERAFLDGETARLKACAHARNIGQTFLQSGNLTQAKAYLARAEQILQVDEKHLRGKSSKDILDEFMQQRRDTYS